METVQAWLNQADEEKLADTYFAAFPINYRMIVDRALTLGEIRDRSRSQFLEFVRRMKLRDAMAFRHVPEETVREIGERLAGIPNT